MKEQSRNYRMFKKRVAEMDIYQEYRRSHERVRVMLREDEANFSTADVESPVSAQENLRNFIKQHEQKQVIKESEPKGPTAQELDQAFVDLQKDTILNPVSPPPSPPNYQPAYQENYEFQDQKYDLNYVPEEQQQLQDNNRTFEVNDQNQGYTEEREQEFVDYKEQRKSVKEENELENIIREALTNINPATNIDSGDIDPELMKMVKEFIYSTNEQNSVNNFSFAPSYADQQYTNPENNNYQNTFPENPIQSNQQTTEPLSPSINQDRKEDDAAILEKQLQDQQVPPKIPSNKTTVRRPRFDSPSNSLETTFSATDYDDDSSLALTKNEIKMQVKNLIKESLAESEEENIPKTKSNDLLQLEKQLKDHIEKLKQSRK